MERAFPVVRRVVEVLFGALAPEVCAACDARIPSFTAFCAPCARTLGPPAVSRAGEVAAFAYGGAIALAITSFKYGGRPDRARPLGHLLRRALGPIRRAPPDVVVPVPLHRARLASRGFNQAALLAGPVARDLGVKHAPLALVRLRDTAAQAGLERDARLRNVASAFAPRTGIFAAKLAGARVLLVDDVRTTGATLAACAAALHGAGAREVVTLVVAAADP